jgi:hypothetical protein
MFILPLTSRIVELTEKLTECLLLLEMEGFGHSSELVEDPDARRRKNSDKCLNPATQSSHHPISKCLNKGIIEEYIHF